MSIDTEAESKYLLFVRSKEVTQLTSGLNTNMRIDLDARIATTNNNSDIHVQLSSCEIPHSMYNLTEVLGNNSLSVNGSVDLRFSPKHYDIYTLVDDINSGGEDSVSIGLSATFDESTSKVTLTNNSGSNMTINFGISKGFAQLIGFPQEDFVINNSSSRGGYYVVNLNTIHSIFVHTNLSLSNVLSTTNKNYDNILQKIPVNTQFGNVINYNPYLASNFSTVVKVNEINSLELSLKDQNGNLLDLNNVSFELSILFEVHDRPILNEFINNRRDEIQQIPRPIPTINENPPSINDIIIPETEQRFLSNINANGTSNLNPSITESPVIDELPTEAIEIPKTTEEDKLLHDKAQLELNKKLIELSLLDDIL